MRLFCPMILLVAIALVSAHGTEAQDTLRLASGWEANNPAAEARGEMPNHEAAVVHIWKQYSKAFEYADYPQIANHFTFPATLIDAAGQPVIVADRKSLIKRYREIRGNIQDGYKYSLLDTYQFHQYSDQVCMVDATYGRFNGSYQRIHTGRGLYFFRNKGDGWQISVIMGLPVEVPAVAKNNHVIQLETVYYTTGPQQGRAPDGKFPAGTVVTVLKEVGSYMLVETEDGVVAYVASGSVKPVDIP